MKICVGLPVIALAWGFTVAVLDFKPEKPCTDANGVCTHKSLCPHSPYNKGLCPEQQKDGAECCYEQGERQCRESAGECSDHCPSKIVEHIPCPGGKKCCVWRKYFLCKDLF